jgi:hypothetical protein
VDRSYALLSYPDTLELPLAGEDLTVNADKEIVVVAGQTTRGIEIKVANAAEPMRVELTLSASMARIPDARFSPGNNLFFQTSADTLKFDLSVPVDTTPGIYYIEWTKSGDTISTSSSVSYVYANLRTTKVRVVND